MTWNNASRGTAPRTATLNPASSRAGARSESRLEILRTEDELAAIESEWNDLYQASASRNPFLSYGWTLACWLADQTGAVLFVVTLRLGDRLVGIAPLCRETRYGLRALRFIADDRSDYLGFLCAADVPGIEQALLDRVLGPRDWDLLLLRRLADTYTSLHRTEVPATVRAHRAVWTSAPYLKGEGDWDGFHKAGPSWLREMRKRSRRFLRDGYRTEHFSGAEAVKWLDSVAHIEARSWKGRHNTTRLQRGEGGDLLRRAFETLGTHGEMELGLAFIGDQPVAFQIDFIHSDRVWHYQCAYDEEFRDARAGSVLTYISLENAWRRGVREFDYLSGDEPYKLERTNGSRAIYRIAVHPPTAKGWIAYALLAGARSSLRNVPALRAIYDSAKSIRRSIRTSSN